MGARTQMNLADVMRWAFMPNITHVQSTDVPDLDPWATPFWKSTASLFVFTAAAHGVHGVVIVRMITSHKRGRRVLFRVIITIVMRPERIGIYLIWTS